MLVIGQTYTGDLQTLRSPSLQIIEQSIHLNVDQVKVHYIYANTSQEPITETLVFALPTNSEEQKQVKVLINQQPIQLHSIVRAINKNGKDISREIKNLGLPYNPIAAIHSIDASSNRDHLIAKLKSLQVIDKHEDTPTWSVKTYYYWQQHFPPESTIQIEQIYKPTITKQAVKLHGLSTIFKLPIKIAKKVWHVARNWTLVDAEAPANNLRAQFEKYWPKIQTYCATENDYKILVEEYKKHPNNSQVNLKELSYSIDPKESWANSINKFSLYIEAPQNMHPILCKDEQLKSVNSKNLQFVAENYIPMQNINVLYIEK